MFDLEFAKQLADPNSSLSVPEPTKAVIRDLVADVERLREQIEALRAIINTHPDPLECGKHDNDTVSCGWKNAFTDVVKALEVEC